MAELDELIDRIGTQPLAPGVELTAEQRDYVVDVICRRIELELGQTFSNFSTTR